MLFMHSYEATCHKIHAVLGTDENIQFWGLFCLKLSWVYSFRFRELVSCKK